jgi:hypothetical protein
MGGVKPPPGLDTGVYATDDLGRTIVAQHEHQLAQADLYAGSGFAVLEISADQCRNLRRGRERRIHGPILHGVRA